ncbi:MAG: class II aldolase/adducin family protein [Leptospirales bacterium]|jgi:L-fuculose-phosphate aldolase
MNQDIDRARKTVLEASLKLADLGFLAGIGGNIALRAGDEFVAVTPSGADYYELAPRDICVLRLDNLKQVAGDLDPSVESGLHASLLRSRTDLKASVHTHQPIASAVAILRRQFPVQDPEARSALGARVGLAGYAPSGTVFLVRAFRRAIRAKVNAYLLGSHGIVCGGADMKQGIRNVQLLEAEAGRYLYGEIKTKVDAGRTDANRPEVALALSIL